MRKQIFAGLIAAVALLFSVVALTSAPAASDNYAAYPSTKGVLAVQIVDPVPCGGPISGAVSGGTAPYAVTVTIAGSVLSATLPASGPYSFPISAATVPAGATTYTYSVTDAGGMTATGTHAATISYSCGSATTGTGGSGVPGGTTGTVDFGFNNNGIPTQPGLAITGTETSILGFIATGLIALGAVAMGSRRKIQGALEG